MAAVVWLLVAVVGAERGLAERVVAAVVWLLVAVAAVLVAQSALVLVCVLVRALVLPLQPEA